MHAAVCLLAAAAALAQASSCPYMDRRDSDGTDFLDQFTLDDTNAFLTSDVGGPIQDSRSLKAGERGPTLLEDFIFRQKIQHFDHERVSPHVCASAPRRAPC
jgi:catalase